MPTNHCYAQPYMNAPSRVSSGPDTAAATLAAAGAEPSSPVLRDVRTRLVEAHSAEATMRMSTGEVREAYLCKDLVAEDAVSLVYWEVDRAVVGVAAPVSAPLLLEAPDCLRAERFCERREVGIVNLGGAGAVRVGDTRHGLGSFDVLYIGKGSGDIVFEPGRGKEAAPLYYMASYPAHRACGTSRIPFAREEGRRLGEKARCNERSLHPMIAPGNAESCQLVMGVTFLKEGSVWNTMPPHTHLRRSEIYFYFDIRDDALVFHFMGKPEETRHIVVRNHEAVLSPGWSIHSGVGTANYGFVWAMGGENQEFGDMDAVDLSKMK